MNIFSAMDMAACALSAYVGISNLVYFLRIKAEKERLHFSLLCFTISLYDAASSLVYASSPPFLGMAWQRLQFFLSIAIAAEVVLFVYRLLSRKIDPPARILLLSFAACLLAALVRGGLVIDEGRPMERTVRALGASVAFIEFPPGAVWRVLLLAQIAGMCYLCVLIVLHSARKREKSLAILTLGFLAFFSSIVVDALSVSGVIGLAYTVEYAFLLLIFGMDDILQKRFIAVRREVESMNRNLGELVSERTSEIRKLADELARANEELKAKNETLTELAERDGMTELLNHAAFHRRVSELFSLSRRHAFPVCVMIIDIDRFKGINDRFGHQAGDEVIRKFADTLKAGSRNYDIKGRFAGGVEPPDSLRNYDIAGRYGGDEFAIALPYCGEAEATIVAERICAMIRSLSFDRYPELRVTASVGCAALADASRASDELRAIRLADRALYAAKGKGRDCYVIRTPDDGIEALE